MTREIFKQPQPYEIEALYLEILLQDTDTVNTDQVLAIQMQERYPDFTERDVRHIVERINYDKYIGMDAKYQWRKINGKYQRIDKDSEHRDKVRAKIKADAMAALKRWHITEHKLGDVNQFNASLYELMKEV